MPRIIFFEFYSTIPWNPLIWSPPKKFKERQGHCKFASFWKFSPNNYHLSEPTVGTDRNGLFLQENLKCVIGGHQHLVKCCKSEYCITACLAQLDWRLVCHGVVNQWQIVLCFWTKTISHKVADHDFGYKVPALSVLDIKGKVLVIMPQEKTLYHLYSL